MWTEPGTLLIRVDAGGRYGSGHLMRCLALAQAWRDRGGPAEIVIAEGLHGALHDRLRSEGIAVRRVESAIGGASDADETTRAAIEAGASWVVVDGYQFGTEFQRRIKEAGLKLLWIDDYGHAAPYVADIVLNQNLNIESAMYRERTEATQLLLGTRYALLRREFARNRGPREFRDEARHVLVTMGGSDAEDVTSSVARALRSVETKNRRIVIVVGASYRHRADLEEAVRDRPEFCIQSDPPSMPVLMSRAEIAVTAAGSTCWELACMGLPAVVLVVAENQRYAAARLHEAGIVVNLGWHSDVRVEHLSQAVERLAADPVGRERMSMRGRRLIDGRGAARAVTAMLG